MPRAFTEYDADQGGYIAKTKVRYRVEKLVDGAWTLMAHVPAETEGMDGLLHALGGMIRVEDVTLKRDDDQKIYVLEKDFE